MIGKFNRGATCLRAYMCLHKGVRVHGTTFFTSSCPFYVGSSKSEFGSNFEGRFCGFSSGMCEERAGSWLRKRDRIKNFIHQVRSVTSSVRFDIVACAGGGGLDTGCGGRTDYCCVIVTYVL